jgi:hypothetical protein
MAISYTATGVFITDDRNPDRAPFVLPADATLADVAAAVAAYIGPTCEPDWTQFRQALRTENGFSAAFSAAMAADPMAGVALALGLDAFRRDGDPTDFLDALRSAFIVLPEGQGTYIAAELLALAQRCNLPASFTDALASLGG